MTNARIKPGMAKAERTQVSQLYVRDLLLYLSDLFGEERMHDPRMAKALKHLVMALQPYSHYSIPEFALVLGRDTGGHSGEKNAPQFELPLQEGIENDEEVDNAIQDDIYTKKELVELGARRFGISRAKLSRLSKDDALAAVRAALDNERALEVIAEQARREGTRRQA